MVFILKRISFLLIYSYFLDKVLISTQLELKTYKVSKKLKFNNSFFPKQLKSLYALNYHHLKSYRDCAQGRDIYWVEGLQKKVNEWIVVYLTIFLFKLFLQPLHSIDGWLCTIPITSHCSELSSIFKTNQLLPCIFWITIGTEHSLASIEWCRS